MSGFPWALGTGNGIRPGVTVRRTRKNCTRVCWCYLLSPDYGVATLRFGCATKNRYATSKWDPPPPLRTLSSEVDGPT